MPPPDIYVISHPREVSAIGRWLQDQLNDDTIAAANKDHVATMLAQNIVVEVSARFNRNNVLNLDMTPHPSDQLLATLRAMGWPGE